MANRARGEVSLSVGRKRYTLRPTLTAYCDLEDRLDKRHTKIMSEASMGDARALRALLWSYLQAHHAEEIATFEEAGRLVDEAGLEAVQAQLEKLQQINAPEGEADPPAARSNGRTSTVPVAGPVSAETTRGDPRPVS